MDTVVNEGKTAAIVAYLTIIGTIIAYFMNNDTQEFLCVISHKTGAGHPHYIFHSWGTHFLV